MAAHRVADLLQECAGILAEDSDRHVALFTAIALVTQSKLNANEKLRIANELAEIGAMLCEASQGDAASYLQLNHQGKSHE